MELPEFYQDKMKQLLGEGQYRLYLDSLSEEPQYGIRLNPLKLRKEEQKGVLSRLGLEKPEPVPWSGQAGYYYDGRKTPARHPYYYAGLYYLQEPSAMAPGAFLPVSAGDRVLDLCAAPGGKSTQLGVRLAGSGFLLSNDISASRAKGLLKNLELSGIGNSFVSSEPQERLAACFPEYFDKILVDAPCSGEGMFRRDPSMVRSWEERGPEAYRPVQEELLLAAGRMLKPGGMLLYSTCTFDERENEGAVEAFLKKMPDMEPVPLTPRWGMVQGLDGASLRFFPWLIRGEGHFLSLMRKKGSAGKENGKTGSAAAEANRMFLNSRREMAEFLEMVKAPLEERGFFWEREGQVYLLPCPPGQIRPLRFLRTGLFLGSCRKKRFEPSQALALYLKKEEFQNTADFSAQDERTVRYLKGETTEDGAGEDGWCLVCTDGFPLGFAKRSRGILKNKYYPGWRWQ